MATIVYYFLINLCILHIHRGYMLLQVDVVMLLTYVIQHQRDWHTLGNNRTFSMQTQAELLGWQP